MAFRSMELFSGARAKNHRCGCCLRYFWVRCWRGFLRHRRLKCDSVQSSCGWEPNSSEAEPNCAARNNSSKAARTTARNSNAAADYKNAAAGCKNVAVDYTNGAAAANSRDSNWSCPGGCQDCCSAEALRNRNCCCQSCTLMAAGQNERRHRARSLRSATLRQSPLVHGHYP